MSMIRKVESRVRVIGKTCGLRLPLPHLGTCPEVIERQRRGVSAEPPRRADTPGLRLAPKMFNDGYVILCLLPR